APDWQAEVLNFNRYVGTHARIIQWEVMIRSGVESKLLKSATGSAEIEGMSSTLLDSLRGAAWTSVQLCEPAEGGVSHQRHPAPSEALATAVTRRVRVVQEDLPETFKILLNALERIYPGQQDDLLQQYVVHEDNQGRHSLIVE